MSDKLSLYKNKNKKKKSYYRPLSLFGCLELCKNVISTIKKNKLKNKNISSPVVDVGGANGGGTPSRFAK